MFGNDLNFMADKATKREKLGTDVVQALMDVQTAEEGLLVASANFDMLITACENIEDSVVLADAIAAKGDENVAVQVARESLRQNLKVLGQEHVVGMVITAGTESIVAANEGVKDMLAKAWAKTKEIAMKIWNWIANLVQKVGHFLMALIGKGDSTYERLVKLVKKHKDSKMTNLDGQEFSESVQKSLNGKFRLLAMEKSVASSGLTTGIEGMTSSLESANDNKSKILEGFLSESSITGMMKAVEGNGDAAKSGDELRTFLNDNVFKHITTAKGVNIRNLPKNASKGLATAIEDAVDNKVQDITGGLVRICGITFDKVICYIEATTDDMAEAISEMEKLSGDELTVAKVTSLANRIIKGYKVVEFTVVPEASDYEDNYKDVAPLEFTEVETIKDAMKDCDKVASKIVKSYGDKISKEKKDLEKVLKNSFKEIDKKDSPLKDKVRSIVSAIINNETKSAKAWANGVVATAKDITSSPVYDYCAESAKLYKKD